MAGFIVTDPRIAIWVIVLLEGALSIFTFGETVPSPSIEVTPRDSRYSDPTAEIAMGTSWIFSARFCAVTTISPIPSSFPFSVWAWAVAAPASAVDASKYLKMTFRMAISPVICINRKLRNYFIVWLRYIEYMGNVNS